MLRIALIGPGDIDFHYNQILGIPKEKLQSELEKIAKVFTEFNIELELLPDRGICLELAKKYKQQGGIKVIGSAPISDKRYGIKHLKSYMDEEINKRKLFDEFIDTKDWRDQYRLKGLLGDTIFYLGTSPGTETELNYAIYLFKLMKGYKKGVSLKGTHLEIRAGKNIPYTFFVYSPFLKSGKFSKEIERYMKKYEINLEYIKNPEELKKKLKKLINLFPRFFK